MLVSRLIFWCQPFYCSLKGQLFLIKKSILCIGFLLIYFGPPTSCIMSLPLSYDSLGLRRKHQLVRTHAILPEKQLSTNNGCEGQGCINQGCKNLSILPYISQFFKQFPLHDEQVVKKAIGYLIYHHLAKKIICCGDLVLPNPCW